ncbi:hypothetical protein ACLOJK_012534 [Asimina triloba]
MSIMENPPAASGHYFPSKSPVPVQATCHRSHIETDVMKAVSPPQLPMPARQTEVFGRNSAVVIPTLAEGDKQDSGGRSSSSRILSFVLVILARRGEEME